MIKRRRERLFCPIQHRIFASVALSLASILIPFSKFLEFPASSTNRHVRNTNSMVDTVKVWCRLILGSVDHGICLDLNLIFSLS